MPLRPLMVLAGLAIAAPIMAHEGAMGVVKERMDGMGLLGKALKELTNLSKEAAIDGKAVADQAEIIANHSGERLLALFPEGSMQNVSEARPDIWLDWSGFEELAYELETEASRLTRATTPEQLRNALAQTKRTCNACHEKFRLEK